MNNPFIEEAVNKQREEFKQRQMLATRQGQPDGPGCENLTPELREKANTIYGESILARPSGTWSQAECDFIRGSVTATLKDLGY